MKINWDAKLPGWYYYFLLPLLFLFIFGEHIQTAWEWGESKIRQLTQTPEEQMLEEIAKSRKTLPEIRKEAEEGSATALLSMGDAYSGGQGVPKSHEIAVQYWMKAYEAAGDLADVYRRLSVKRHTAAMLRRAYSHGRGVPENEAEAEKWNQRKIEAIRKIEAREKARRQKEIEEHKAMIPQ